MKKLATAGLALSLAFSTITVTAMTTPITVAASDVNTQSMSQFKDWNAKADWATSMDWMVSKGLIGGTTIKNPSTGKEEQFLKPRDTLTEAQFVSILYRYKDPVTLRSTPQQGNWWASPAYVLSAKDKLPTLGSLSNKASANKGVSRGKMAQIFASKHFGKPVTEREAVQFMYDAGLSNGYSVNGKSPKTYESFGPKDQLQRAHISAFFQRYDAKYGSMTGETVSPKPPTSVTPPPVTKPPTTNTGGQTVGGIKVEYGNHTYGSKSQAEYDKVMEIARKAIKNHKRHPESVEYLDAYLSGKRFDGDRSNRDPLNMALYKYENTVGDLVRAGASKEIIVNLVVAESVSASLLQGIHDPLDGTPRSAYDALVRGVSDCDPQAHVRNLIMDLQGFTTATVSGPGHAEAFVKVGDTWMNHKAGSFKAMTPSNMTPTQYLKGKTLTTSPQSGQFK